MRYDFIEMQFVGGPLAGKMLVKDFVENPNTRCLYNGKSEDLTEARNAGACVHREELDNQIQVKGYLGPMFNEYQYYVPNSAKGWYYNWELPENANILAVKLCLRYETQEVYDAMFN